MNIWPFHHLSSLHANAGSSNTFRSVLLKEVTKKIIAKTGSGTAITGSYLEGNILETSKNFYAQHDSYGYRCNFLCGATG